MKKKRSDAQTVNVVILDTGGQIQLSCHRRFAANGGDDSIRISASNPADSTSVEISLQVGEAEDFFELVMPLVNDSKERPFSGSLCTSTIIDGKSSGGAKFTVSVVNQDDYDARIELHSQRKQISIGFDVNRTVMEQWLKASLDGICDDVDDDD